MGYRQRSANERGENFDELESKVELMQRDHEDQIEWLQQTIKLLKDDVGVVSRRVAAQSQLRIPGLRFQQVEA